MAGSVSGRVLILQGGRDYQLTVEDDLTVWRTALDDGPDVAVHVYPALNHLFTLGEGPSSATEHEPAQHIDLTGIAAITDWLHTTGV